MKEPFNSTETFIKTFKTKLKHKFVKTLEESSNRERYLVLGEMVQDHITEHWHTHQKAVKEQSDRRLHYFSMEFLMGRLITNNLHNLGLRTIVEESFDAMGLDLHAIEHKEVDAGLGNGGLGRLAACFLDSIASLKLNGHGNGIRYRYGLFEQGIRNGYQIEKPDDWLKDEYVWEIRREEAAVRVKFGGDVMFENGDAVYEPDEEILAVPYDVPIVGYKNGVINHLRLWNAEPTEIYPADMHAFDYADEIREISGFLYPDDTTKSGKILRIKQQYFFSSAGVQSIMKTHHDMHGNFDDFHKRHVFQINDTHPTLIIPEMMRILLDEHGYTWDHAWDITRNTCAYTNHTLLAEALEKWPTSLIQPTLPRIYQIIEEINKRFCEDLLAKDADHKKMRKMAIIDAGEVRMAHLAIAGSFSVNGVAKLHTDILTKYEMNDFYQLYPEKFNSKTNGITHRRWCEHINPELTTLIKNHVGDWISDLDKLKAFEKQQGNKEVRNTLKQIKHDKKKALAKRIKQEQGIELDPNSIFDVQIKRLHEYKRQLMNALHIMMVYNKLKTDIVFKKNYVPHTFIFGAKAASAYHYAKKIIKLINTIAEKVNNDPDTNTHLKVVFVENYNVTYAEQIIPASDISEQISTATKEASGTGNMKFMMNGALTIGTLDGANVEIAELVGDDNIEIFGMDAEQVTELNKKGDYDPQDILKSDAEINTAVEQLTNGFFDKVSKHEFEEVRNKLTNDDQYYVLKDLRAYAQAHENLNAAYQDEARWFDMTIINIAKSGYFSSDRTINDYARDIWKLKPFDQD